MAISRTVKGEGPGANTAELALTASVLFVYCCRFDSLLLSSRGPNRSGAPDANEQNHIDGISAQKRLYIFTYQCEDEIGRKRLAQPEHGLPKNLLQLVFGRIWTYYYGQHAILNNRADERNSGRLRSPASSLQLGLLFGILILVIIVLEIAFVDLLCRLIIFSWMDPTSSFCLR
jgi:hypothetical protein